MSSPSTAPIDREFAFSQKDFEFLSDIAYTRTGIVLKDHKFDMVYARIARRLRALKLNTMQEYCDLLVSPRGDDEMGNLVNAITTNLTSFFREPHHFEHLHKHVLAPFAKQGKEARLRIWSAGCSAGAEPYSIAMTMRESIANAEQRDCKILATDIDTNMLDKGISGEYNEDWVEKIPAPLRLKYLEVGTYRMASEVRSLITFKQLNLLEAWPMKGPFDAIFCRNVVIYFDKKTQATLFDRYADLLKPNGYLYIGHSETLHNVCDRFAAAGKTTYQRVK